MIKVLLADDQELIRQSLSFVMSRQEDIEMAVSYTHLTLPTNSRV